MTTARESGTQHAQFQRMRRELGQILERTPSFRALPAVQQRKLTADVQKVMGYLADPAAGQAELAPTAARALASPEPPPAFGPAAQSAPGVMSGLVRTVDFPKFVSSLIEGVFTSIVNSSIKQMQEFGKFLEGVVKSVEDFAQDHISPAQARNFLQNKFPGAFGMQDGKLVAGDTGDQPPPDLQAALGMADKPDLDSDEGEKKLVLAAQLKMARMRQQELSTLVLMGINRIVVTEGEIKASVLFDVTAHDSRDSTYTRDVGRDDTAASRSDYSGKWHGDAKAQYNYKDDSQSYQSNAAFSFDNSWSGGSARTTVSTDHAHLENKSSDTIDAHAKLAGSVLVKFKSETFPLERLASTADLATIQQKSSATGARGTPPPAEAAAPMPVAPTPPVLPTPGPTR